MDPVYVGEATAPKIQTPEINPTPPPTQPSQTPPASEYKHFNWHWRRWVLVVVAVLTLSLVAGYIAYRPQFLSQTSYTCPATEWIDCMPMVGPDGPVKRSQCEPDYLTWAKANCPGFQGAAY